MTGRVLRAASRGGLVAAVLGILLLACTNNPYPAADDDLKILYTTFREAPRSLDPAVAYDTGSHAITGEVYATCLLYTSDAADE